MLENDKNEMINKPKDAKKRSFINIPCSFILAVIVLDRCDFFCKSAFKKI